MLFQVEIQVENINWLFMEKESEQIGKIKKKHTLSEKTKLKNRKRSKKWKEDTKT